MKKILLTAVAALAATAMHAQNDWANHGRYAEANAALTQAPEVVFMGNSITDGWDDHHGEFFTDNNFACRGISGQVTGQMLCRFYSDVINLKPKAVVILAGTNDIAGNQGYMAIPHIVENIISMAELAKMSGIRPLIATAIPCDTIPWNANITGTAAKVQELNAQLRKYAEANGVTFVDYYTPMATPEGALKPEYTYDRVHPNRAGYEVMEPIILEALASKPCCKKDDAIKCDMKGKDCSKKDAAIKCDMKGKDCSKKDAAAKCDKKDKPCCKKDDAIKCDMKGKDCSKKDAAAKCDMKDKPCSKKGDAIKCDMKSKDCSKKDKKADKKK